MDIQEERRAALRKFVADEGGHASVVAKYGLTASQGSYLSQLTADGSTASFGELSAKNWEIRLRLKAGHLVTPKKPDFDANVRFEERGKMRAYPVISAIQAGKVKEATNPYQPGDGFDFEYGDEAWSDWTFVLVIEGLSMYPDFQPGDRVIIDPEVRPSPGDYVAAKNSVEEATFKKYRLKGVDPRGNDVFELVPLNSDFPTLRSDEHQLHIIGTMVEFRRRFKRSQ